MSAPQKTFDRTIVEGSLPKAVWMLAWPTMLQNIIGGMQGIVDHVMVGNYVGYTGNAAIGVSWQIFLVVIVFISSLFTGMGVLVARFTGANEPNKVNRTVYQAFLTAVLLVLVIMAPIGYLLSPVLLDLVNGLRELDERVAALERRFDALGESASSDDEDAVMELRLHVARLSAELTRATVELQGQIAEIPFGHTLPLPLLRGFFPGVEFCWGIVLLEALCQLLQVAAGGDRLVVGSLDLNAHLEVVGQFVDVPIGGLDVDAVIFPDVVLQRFEEGGVRRFKGRGDILGFFGNRQQLFADCLGQRA